MPILKYPTGGVVKEWKTNLTPAEQAWYSYIQSTGIEDEPMVRDKFIYEYNKNIESYKAESKELKDLSGVANNNLSELNILVEDYNTNFKPQYDELYNETESLKKELGQKGLKAREKNKLVEKYEAKVKELKEYIASYSDKTAKYEALRKVVDDALSKVKSQKEKVYSSGLGKFYQNLEYKKNKIVQSKQQIKPIYNRRPTHAKSVGSLRIR